VLPTTPTPCWSRAPATVAIPRPPRLLVRPCHVPWDVAAHKSSLVAESTRVAYIIPQYMLLVGLKIICYKPEYNCLNVVFTIPLWENCRGQHKLPWLCNICVQPTYTYVQMYGYSQMVAFVH
jgi:hypothetical protein